MSGGGGHLMSGVGGVLVSGEGITKPCRALECQQEVDITMS